jgi:uncharacterized membrane protein YcaP (DUF421 family)
MDWNEFVNHALVPGISIVEKIIRTVIVYLFLVIALRLVGRRDISQINSGDLVVLLLLSNTVQNAIIGEDNSLVGGILGAAVLLFINDLLNRLTYRHPRLSQLLEGTKIYLIKNGKIIPRALEHNLLSLDELEVAVRREGVEKLSGVKDCILEADGTITVIPKKDVQTIRDEHKAHLNRIEKKLDELLSSQNKTAN